MLIFTESFERTNKNLKELQELTVVVMVGISVSIRVVKKWFAQGSRQITPCYPLAPKV